MALACVVFSKSRSKYFYRLFPWGLPRTEPHSRDPSHPPWFAGVEHPPAPAASNKSYPGTRLCRFVCKNIACLFANTLSVIKQPLPGRKIGLDSQVFTAFWSSSSLRDIER